MKEEHKDMVHEISSNLYLLTKSRKFYAQEIYETKVSEFSQLSIEVFWM